MILTRQEKEKLILDLYNEGKTYKQIVETARVSPRSIKPVLEKATSCQEEEANIDKLEQEEIRLKRLVKRFKDNDEEYLKIKKQ